MNLRELLPREHVVMPLAAPNLSEALVELARALQASGAAHEAVDPVTAFEDSQLRGTVAVGDHVALPHFRTTAVSEVVLALGIAREPLNADTLGLEIRPRIVALILAPPEAATPYLQTVSTLARFFKRDDRVASLLSATTPEEVIEVIAAGDVRIQPRLTVRDIMVPVPARIGPDASVREAVDLMTRSRLGVIPVVGEKGEVLGTISDRDVMRGLLSKTPRAGEEDVEAGDRANLADIKVRDLMTRLVLCISEDSGLDEAASILINKDVPQLPVVSEGKLTGLLGRGDIIRKLYAS